MGLVRIPAPLPITLDDARPEDWARYVMRVTRTGFDELDNSTFNVRVTPTAERWKRMRQWARRYSKRDLTDMLAAAVVAFMRERKDRRAVDERLGDLELWAERADRQGTYLAHYAQQVHHARSSGGKESARKAKAKAEEWHATCKERARLMLKHNHAPHELAGILSGRFDKTPKQVRMVLQQSGVLKRRKSALSIEARLGTPHRAKYGHKKTARHPRTA